MVTHNDERRPAGGGVHVTRDSTSVTADTTGLANLDLSVPEILAEDAVLTAALKYATAGWYVGPLRNGTKDPGSRLGKGWQRKTSRTPEVIASWFCGTSDGLFLHAGRSGAVAFDVDRPDRIPERLARAIAECLPPYQSTRRGVEGRGHYVFTFRAGRVLGNGTGALGGEFGEIRGRNGVIVVEPTQHENVTEGGRYHWLRAGAVPELPEQVDVLLHDSLETEGAATDAEVERFLAEHIAAERPELLGVWCSVFAKGTSEGQSRHDRMTSVAVGAMKEAAAGLIPARLAADTLESAFLAAVARAPITGGQQGAARSGGVARSEWNGILSWAIGQAKIADLVAVRARAAEKVPQFTADIATSADPGLAATPITLAAAHAVFRRWLGPDYDLDALDAVLAAAAVERLDGDPLWLLLVSGPGFTKTETVASLVGAGARVVSSISGEAGLLSATAAKERAKDATGGLLREIGGRGILVVKDVTTILAMNRDRRAETLGALREVYDGAWTRNVGSDGGRALKWEGRIVVIGAVTTAWDSAHAVISAMGDRFALLRIDSGKGRLAAGRQALANVGYEVEMRAALADAVAGVLAGIDTTVAPTLSEEVNEVLLAAADLVTRARTAVERDHQGNVMGAHAPEAPTRFAKMLAQVARGALTLGLREGAAVGLALRIAADSMPPLRLLLLRDVDRAPESRTSEVTKRVQRPRTTVDRTLQELHVLGLLVCDDFGDGDGWRYTLAEGVDLGVLERNQECSSLPLNPKKREILEGVPSSETGFLDQGSDIPGYRPDVAHGTPHRGPSPRDWASLRRGRGAAPELR